MPTTTKPSILIVDDEPDVLFSLTGLLRRDFQVFTAKSGAEAMKVMAEQDVHVIMTDQRMPSMTGTELMGKVRAEHPDAVRIIFTGYADTRAVVDAINSGELYRYISKPWDPDDLIEVLRDAAQKYNETIAEAKLLSGLDDYFDDAVSFVTSDEPAVRDADAVETFKSRTETLRTYLRLLKGSDARP
ncbi:response regulator [Allorhodopirellula heiligendammensis]|uniref:Hydrogenase transcriptional regulatory protein hupR1 n=1 Tax=Allorhodopirellula heiligendammensis TaxID=2714739 RepID=A0A5C6BZH1_9BACT|nr:response regulator [Allorhodopirellula heiligendammensis]TWU16334.1 Hydrogenase transcriptional regulatory protein hupR1 [Allorhodopirellula heiligendammensis]